MSEDLKRRTTPDEGAIEKLRTLGENYVERGDLPSAQMSLAWQGELLLNCAWGDVNTDAGIQKATPTTLYVAFSTTKAVVAAGIWKLLAQGLLSEDDPVSRFVPGFDSRGKERVTVAHLLTHTAGFPNAPFDSKSWPNQAERNKAFGDWRVDWEPGSRFHYHGTSSMWVLAAIMEFITQRDFREYLRTDLLAPLGLHDLHIGLQPNLHDRVAHVCSVGTMPSAETFESMGLSGLSQANPDEHYLRSYNEPLKREAGVPGAGGIMTAASLALFYQALLRPERSGVLSADIIDRARVILTGDYEDPFTGRAANRSLGLVISGDEDRVYRSFAPNHSSLAFGHPGAGGQIGWADPETGLSFAFFTNGCERNPLAIGMRTLSLSNQAAQCLQTEDTQHE